MSIAVPMSEVISDHYRQKGAAEEGAGRPPRSTRARRCIVAAIAARTFKGRLGSTRTSCSARWSEVAASYPPEKEGGRP